MFNKFLGLILSALFGISLFGQCVSTNSDFDLSLSIVPRATYLLEDFHAAIEDNQPLPEMVSITAFNNSSSDEEVKLRMIVTVPTTLSSTPGLPSSIDQTTLMDATTVGSSDGFPISVPANSSKLISNTDFDLNQSGQVHTRVHKDDVKNFVTSRYSSVDGVPDADTFTYTVYMFRKSDSDDPSNALACATDTIHQPKSTGEFNLLLPNPDVPISLSDLRTNFSWEKPQIRYSVASNTDLVSLTYTVKLWQASFDEGNGKITRSFEEVKQENPIFEEKVTDITQLVYPDYADLLQPDTDYYWTVNVVDGVGEAVGGILSLQQGQFSVEPVPAPRLEEQVIESSQLPALSWEGHELADHYDVVISSDSAFTTQDIFTTIGNAARMIFEDESQFEPNKTYYWKIQAYHDSGDKWGPESEVGTFRIVQELNLLSPAEGSDIDNSQSLYFNWDPIQGATQYRLELSTDQTFALLNPSEPFIVEDSYFSLSPDQAQLSDFTAYYWRVIPLRDGLPWGANSAPVSQFMTLDGASKKASETGNDDEPFLALPITQVEQTPSPSTETNTETNKDEPKSVNAEEPEIEEAPKTNTKASKNDLKKLQAFIQLRSDLTSSNWKLLNPDALQNLSQELIEAIMNNDVEVSFKVETEE